MTERMSRKELRRLREEQRRKEESAIASTVPSQRAIPQPSYPPAPRNGVDTQNAQVYATRRASVMPASTDPRGTHQNLGGRGPAPSPDQTMAGSAYSAADDRLQAEQRVVEARAKLEALKRQEQLRSGTPTASTAPAAAMAGHGAPSRKKENVDTDNQYRSVKPRKRQRRFDIISWFGELLVTVGVILGLFAFWQVVVTDMQVSDLKDNALVNFYDDVDCTSTISKDKRKDNPPILEVPADGKTFAALHIPRWDYASLPVRETTLKPVLDAGAAGHYDKTIMPGDIGNFSIAAHRVGFGSSFKRIEELKDGDPVIVETKDAWFVYKLYSTEVVLPSESRVIYPVPNERGVKPKERLMTMTTCHPLYGNSHRYIVHLKLDYWTPHDAGVPEELAKGGKFKCT